jgi:hypothetical protein
MTKRDHQAKEYAEESGSLDGYHPMVRDFILGQGCFSQEKQKEMHERVWRRLQERVSVAMVETLREGFAAVDKRWDEFKQPCADEKCEKAPQGMRTELVTLEFEVERGSPPSEWPWSYILSRSDALKMRPGESVRVVDETHFDDLAQVAMERDAAIRERDEAKARVAELEARKSTAGEGSCEAQAASGGGEHKVTEGDCLSTVRDAGGRAMPKGPAPGLVAKRAASGVILDSDDVFQRLHNWRQRWSSNLDGDRCGLDDFLGAEILEDLVDYVCEIRAASGGGEPVAWGVVSSADPPHRVVLHWDQDLAERWARQKQSEYTTQLVVVPLYRAPPQPRGWLSEEERELIAGITDDDEYTEEGQNIAKALLARSSPPEVVLPENPYHPSGLREGFDHAIRIVRNELVNAGVEVKDATK